MTNKTGMGNRDYVRPPRIPSERALVEAELTMLRKELFELGEAFVKRGERVAYLEAALGRIADDLEQDPNWQGIASLARRASKRDSR